MRLDKPNTLAPTPRLYINPVKRSNNISHQFTSAHKRAFLSKDNAITDLDAPEFDGPVDGGADEEMGEVERSGGGVCADARHRPKVALVHLLDAGPAAVATRCITHRDTGSVVYTTDRTRRQWYTRLTGHGVSGIHD